MLRSILALELMGRCRRRHTWRQTRREQQSTIGATCLIWQTACGAFCGKMHAGCDLRPKAVSPSFLRLCQNFPASTTQKITLLPFGLGAPAVRSRPFVASFITSAGALCSEHLVTTCVPRTGFRLYVRRMQMPFFSLRTLSVNFTSSSSTVFCDATEQH